MRPGQNKRMRGRNNRKGPNPLSRSYESNGPDVKIRGTAQHIGEKYLQLARDAQSSGDTVVAENYLQHAEHYFRIISSAQTAQQAQMGYSGNGEEVEEDEDDDFVALPDRFASPFERAPQPQPVLQQPPQGNRQAPFGGQPQPYLERPVFASDMNDRSGERAERPERDTDRQNNAQGERPPRNDRRFPPQGERNQQRGRRHDQQPRFEPAPVGAEQPRVEFEQPMAILPAFITSPPRTPVNAGPAPGDEQPSIIAADAGVPSAEDQEGRFHLRPRRRRRPREEASAEGEGSPTPEVNSAE